MLKDAYLGSESKTFGRVTLTEGTDFIDLKELYLLVSELITKAGINPAQVILCGHDSDKEALDRPGVYALSLKRTASDEVYGEPTSFDYAADACSSGGKPAITVYDREQLAAGPEGHNDPDYFVPLGGKMLQDAVILVVDLALETAQYSVLKG